MTMLSLAAGIAYWLGLGLGSCCIGPLACTLLGLLILWGLARPTRAVREAQTRMGLRRQQRRAMGIARWATWWSGRRARRAAQQDEYELRRHLANIKNVWDSAPTDAH